jgi:hypothetical protein
MTFLSALLGLGFLLFFAGLFLAVYSIVHSLITGR